MGIRRKFTVLVLGIGSLTGCWFASGCFSTTPLDSVHAGRTSVYEAGVPNFDMEALATIRDGQAGIDLYIGIPHASLVFLPEGKGYLARFETLVHLRDRKGKTLLAEYDDVDTVRVQAYETTLDFVPYIKRKRLPVAPGTYVLDVVLTDAESDQQVRRQQRVEVVVQEGRQPVLSRIRLEGRQAAGRYEPVLSLHVPAGLDSLRAVIELYDARALDTVQVAMRLLKFPSDTTAASLPYLFTIENAYTRVRYDRADTLQITRRRLHNLDPEMILEFELPALKTGLYRVEVTATAGKGAAPLMHRQRDFAVRGAAFPRIATLDEMVETLVYITQEEEREHIRSADTQAEKKRRFDAFWGGLIPNRSQAADVIKRYYGRVEEA
ncbi:MAG: GWxTD domain-containing protein, partial [Rhodothermales bacterium]